MKTKTDFNFATLNKEQSTELTNMVKETVAKEFVSPKNFTIADLWNIHRKNKNRANSRHFA